jgi:hypothetical protein
LLSLSILMEGVWWIEIGATPHPREENGERLESPL